MSMTSDRLIRVCVLIALAAVSLEARGSQEVRQDVRIATAVAGAGVATPSVSTPMSPITSTGTGLIIGRVIDAGTGRPVGGALVSIGGSGPPAPARAMVVNGPGGQQMTVRSARPLDAAAHDRQRGPVRVPQPAQGRVQPHRRETGLCRRRLRTAASEWRVTVARAG